MKDKLALFKVDELKLLYSYMTINNKDFPYQSRAHVYLWSSRNLFKEF